MICIKMTMEPQETDIEYILSHWREPENLVDPEFVSWLQEPGNRQLFEQIRNQREAFMQAEFEHNVDINREYQRLQAKIHFRRRQAQWKWTVAAASAVVIFCLSMIFWYSRIDVGSKDELVLLEGKKSAELIMANGKRVPLENNRIELREKNGILIVNDSTCSLSYYRDTLPAKSMEEKEAVYNTIRVPAGADYMVILADGTKVRLNCETEFRFPVEFTGKERRVFLEGEAYFEVKKAAEWPFIVETSEMKVKVTGTCFNVKSYGAEEGVYTTLVNGVVEVSVNNISEVPVKLHPSQQYCLHKQTRQAEVKEVDVSLYTGWTEGMFVFKNQRLEEVMNTLARWYTIDVFYVGERVKDLRLSANLGRYEHIDSLLEVLRAMDKVNIERKGKVVTISRK